MPGAAGFVRAAAFAGVVPHGELLVRAFVAVALLWFGLSLYIDANTQSILTEKVSQLFPVNLFVLTTLIGGLVGGFASMTGSLLKP